MDGSQQQSSLDGLGTLDGSSLTAADGLLLHSTFSAGGQSQRGGSQYRTTGHIKALDMSVEEEDTEEVTFSDKKKL
jgi:hypothetical protein